MTYPFAEWLCLDIETVNGSPDDAEKFIRDAYRPEAFNTWTENTIGRHVKEAYAKKKERLSLLTASPIICVSVKTPTAALCFHCLQPANGNNLAIAGDDMTEMLISLRNWLDEWTDSETILVGHNIIQFDLPKLRWAYARYGVRIPKILQGHAQTFDTMKIYTSKFAVASSNMVSLNQLLEEFQVESHKGLISGADVQQLYTEGHHDTIIQYAILDVMAESELFLRMTGRSEALQ